RVDRLEEDLLQFLRGRQLLLRRGRGRCAAGGGLLGGGGVIRVLRAAGGQREAGDGSGCHGHGLPDLHGQHSPSTRGCQSPDPTRPGSQSPPPRTVVCGGSHSPVESVGSSPPSASCSPSSSVATFQARLSSGSAGWSCGSSVSKVAMRPGPVSRVSKRTVTTPTPLPWTQPWP